MKTSTVLSGLALLAQAMAQQVGTQQTEVHPKLAWKRCTGANSAGKSCTTVNGEVVIDANWRWAHLTGNTSNCFDGNAWTGVCKTNTECATNCAVEGADYSTTYGVTTSGDALTLKFVTTHTHGTNVGSRMYLLDGPNNYQMFTLMNNEFAFDVDLSSVKCGMNSALYFVPMKADGGLSTEPNNKAGARYGTGYCDAQCARDLKFINGKANVEGWAPSKQDKNAGVGVMGACCAEIDIWESNSQAYAFTPHTCEAGKATYHVCTGNNCGGTYSEDRFAGSCDANGCDYNAYRAGNHEFYGPGKTVDTNSKFTVISRFQPDDHYQVFIQNGKVIQTPAPSLPGLTQYNGHITDAYCNGAPALFGDRNRHKELGGASTLDPALRVPMVLVMSIWADFFAQMLWLDGLYPEDSTAPGALRGRCPAGNRAPDYLVSTFPNASVTWSNIRFGPIGSTHDTTGSGPVNPPTTTQGPAPVTTTTRAPPTTTTAPPPGGAVVPKWGQCGGQGWTGPTQCAAGSTCTVGNQWYSQCL